MCLAETELLRLFQLLPGGFALPLLTKTDTNTILCLASCYYSISFLFRDVFFFALSLLLARVTQHIGIPRSRD